MRIELSDTDIKFIEDAVGGLDHVCNYDDCGIYPVLKAIEVARRHSARCETCGRHTGHYIDCAAHTSVGYSSTPSSSASHPTTKPDCSACHFWRSSPDLEHTCGVW